MLRRASILAILLTGCTSLPFAPADADHTPNPAVNGPFPVGVRTVTYLDENRPKKDGSPRIVVTEIWYPAVEEARGQAGVVYDIRSVLTDEQRAQVADVKVDNLSSAAVRDALPRVDDGPYPLVVFSHGQGGLRWQSTFYTIALASHGYVVVSPDHEGNTLPDMLRDGLSQVLEGFESRPRDVSYLIDVFTTLPSSDFLAGMINTDDIGLTGHSFGGLTSFRTAALDTRIKAIVPQAPTSSGLAFAGLTPGFQLDIPVMIQAARLDQTLPWDEHITPTWPLLKKPKVLLELKTGGHFTFSDLCAFDLATMAERVGFADVSNVVSDGCGEGAPRAAVAQPIMNHYAIGFFNAILRHSPGSWNLLDQAHADALGAGVAAVSVER